MRNRWKEFLVLAALAAPLALLGCSGSSGDGAAGDTVAPSVSASPPGGTYNAALTVILTASDNTDPDPAIYYTLDGSPPTATSNAYTVAIDIAATTTLQFIAIDAAGNSSAVMTEVYTLELAPGGGQVAGTSATPSADLTEIAARVAAVLALGYNTTNPDAVMKQLSGLDPAKQPEDLFILDTRDAADYATGHIPGAVNIPLRSLPQALLDGTSGIPLDKEVVVASYWGNDGNMASLLINLCRVEDPTNAGAYPKATGLFQGMTS